VTPTFRVRYNRKPQGGQQRPADVESVDVRADLDHIPGQLPPGSYILSVEDLAAGRALTDLGNRLIEIAAADAAKISVDR